MKRLATFKYVLILLLLVGLFLAGYVQYAPIPKYQPVENISYNWKKTNISITEGKKLAVAICSKCHLNYDTQTLAGRQHGNLKRIGSFWSGNITQDLETGIGGWTENELFYFLKTGINKEGNFIFDMPKYPNLSDEDMSSLIGFLKSSDALVQPTKLHNPAPKYSFLTKSLLHFWLRPVAFIDQPIEAPDSTHSIDLGKYLTEKYSCFDCHSRHSVTNNYLYPEKSWKYFQGGNPHANEAGERVYSLNLTPDEESGIGKWTKEDFLYTLKTGVTPNGNTIRDPMFPFPMLADNELISIYEYLRTLKPSKNNY